MNRLSGNLLTLKLLAGKLLSLELLSLELLSLKLHAHLAAGALDHAGLIVGLAVGEQLLLDLLILMLRGPNHDHASVMPAAMATAGPRMASLDIAGKAGQKTSTTEGDHQDLKLRDMFGTP